MVSGCAGRGRPRQPRAPRADTIWAGSSRSAHHYAGHVVLLLLLVVTVLVSIGQRREWRWVQWLDRRWRRIEPPVWAWVRSAPLTYTYLGLLAFTTWLLARTGTDLRHAFLAAQSTNLHELSVNPIPVLLRSAFYVTPVELIVWLVTFTVVLAPLERWIGRGRWLTAFWTGHIGATLVTATGIAWSVAHRQLPRDAAFSVDVGASYGVAALLGMAGYWFGGRIRWLWAACFVTAFTAVLVVEPDFTNAGHLVAFLLGLAMYPLVRRLRPRAPVLGPHS